MDFMQKYKIECQLKGYDLSTDDERVTLAKKSGETVCEFTFGENRSQARAVTLAADAMRALPIA